MMQCREPIQVFLLQDILVFSNRSKDAADKNLWGTASALLYSCHCMAVAVLLSAG